VATDGEVHDPVVLRDVDLRIGRFLPEPSQTEGVDRAIQGPPHFVDLTADEDAYWELGWTDVSPGDLHWHEPMVRVDASDDGGPWWPAADDGDGSVAVHHDGEHRRRHRYTARWYRPDVRAGRRHRFVLAANNGRPEVPGDPFD
jgi:neutral ceramidase